VQVLAEKTHTLQKKVIDPKRAQTRGAIEVCRKIFVGGLDPNLPEESIREYFGAFGKVRSVLSSDLWSFDSLLEDLASLVFFKSRTCGNGKV